MSDLSERARKLSRSERNEETRRKLFTAAAKVVGDVGYADASVARITSAAGIAQGTFYNHFASRQDLLDRLLPTLGEDMLAFIEARVPADASDAEQEIARCRGFFAFLHVCPGYLRILNEAEFFAPVAYKELLAMIGRGYLRVLQRARRRGTLVPYSDAELEAIVQALVGARAYLSRRYAYAEGGVDAVPDHVLSAYAKLVTEGLFRRTAE
ncbi:MAG: TetR/AcrR family transcriptional regulator [Rhodospirillales bacterium]|nr:TetR/AcrR family transcriptional regulator [Rhodospirillales bacterium]